MTDQNLIYLTQFSVIAYALVSGVFLTFSDFVMKSLAATETSGGIEAMQQINIKVIPTLFMILFLGMALLSAGAFYFAQTRMSGPEAVMVSLGAILYFIGTFLVTIFKNVPMNKRLALMHHTDTDAIQYWDYYARNWTAWNSIRAWTSMAAAICFLLAVVELAKT